MGVGNLTKVLRDKNATRTEAIEAVIGTVAQFSSYYGTAYNGLKAIIGFLSQKNEVQQDKLDEIEAKLEEVIGIINEARNDILAAEEGEGILNRINEIEDWLAPLRSTVEMITMMPPHEPSPDTEPCLTYTNQALTAITALESHGKWISVCYPTLYERPVESNIEDPVDDEVTAYSEEENPPGTVKFSGTDFFWDVEQPPHKTGDPIYNYEYILQGYIEAVLHGIIIIGACDPKNEFRKKYRDWADILWTKHNEIISYIRRIRRPIYTFQNPQDYERWRWHGRPYGAVEPYGPCTSIGCWREVPNYAFTMDDFVRGHIPFVRMHAVRTLRRWKSVYNAIGLPAVWRIVNHLRQLAGEAPVGSDLSAYSLRELCAEVYKSDSQARVDVGCNIPAPPEATSLAKLAGLFKFSAPVSLRRIVSM